MTPRISPRVCQFFSQKRHSRERERERVTALRIAAFACTCTRLFAQFSLAAVLRRENAVSSSFLHDASFSSRRLGVGLVCRRRVRRDACGIKGQGYSKPWCVAKTSGVTPTEDLEGVFQSSWRRRPRRLAEKYHFEARKQTLLVRRPWSFSTRSRWRVDIIGNVFYLFAGKRFY